MTEQPYGAVLRTSDHARVLRYVAAAHDGLDAQFLTAAESAAAAELQQSGLIVESGGRLRLSSANQLEHVRELLEHSVSAGATRADESEIARLIAFMRELSDAIVKCEVVADLYHAAFGRLFHALPFDIAVASMLEQNLDIHLSKRAGSDASVDERLIKDFRATLQTQIPVSFADVVVRSDYSDLPAATEDGDPIAHRMHTVLRLEGRTAGMLAIYRRERPFGVNDERMLEILASQVSMALSNIRAQEQIQNLADTDELTGIWNKRYFRRQLSSEVDRARVYNLTLSLMMFDLDDFKVINDRYGHPMGDVVLSELCGAVRESLRDPDQFARFGGDEFAIILPHTDLYGARSVAERIQQKVQHLEIAGDGGQIVRCGISVGIATYVPPDMTAADLIQRADDKLYAAKKNGKGRTEW